MLWSLMDYHGFDRFCKHAYGYCVGFSVVLMFLSTCALIGDCIPVFGSITRLTEVTYGNCIADVIYQTYNNESLHTKLQVPCPYDIENYERTIVVSYSPWNNENVRLGWPWMSYDEAILLYKSGLFIFFVSVPYYIYMHMTTTRHDEGV